MYLFYIPSYFLRKRLKRYDEYNREESITSLKEIGSIPNEHKDTITFAWITTAKFEANLNLALLNNK